MKDLIKKLNPDLIYSQHSITFQSRKDDFYNMIEMGYLTPFRWEVFGTIILELEYEFNPNPNGK